MGLLERVVLPLDGSRLSEAVMLCLRPMVAALRPEITVVRAITPDEMTGFLTVPPAVSEEVQRYAGAWERTLRAEGFEAHSVVRSGPAADVIVDVAAEREATLVAMSTHGRTGLQRWMLGSVAEKVVRGAPAPVFLARSFQPPPEWPPKTILVPVDRGALSLEAVGPAGELARRFGSRVRVVHVAGAEGPAVMELERAVGRLRERGVEADAGAAEGDAASGILEEARRQSAALIVMSTHGRTGPSRWALGSVTEKVLRGAAVPMLVVRGRARSTLAL